MWLGPCLEHAVWVSLFIVAYDYSRSAANGIVTKQSRGPSKWDSLRCSLRTFGNILKSLSRCNLVTQGMGIEWSWGIISLSTDFVTCPRPSWWGTFAITSGEARYDSVGASLRIWRPCTSIPNVNIPLTPSRDWYSDQPIENVVDLLQVS